MSDDIKVIQKLDQKDAQQNKASKPRVTPELLEQLAKLQGVKRRIMSK